MKQTSPTMNGSKLNNFNVSQTSSRNKPIKALCSTNGSQKENNINFVIDSQMSTLPTEFRTFTSNLTS